MKTLTATAAATMVIGSQSVAKDEYVIISAIAAPLLYPS
ncbi:hypothetical protein I656_03126 [Geobacillus sp. WSUCF1]|jgi:hypothetical protein|nr:hypothetical protein I656_03126 [Geobacillus sp. WSUCF1]